MELLFSLVLNEAMKQVTKFILFIYFISFYYISNRPDAQLQENGGHNITPRGMAGIEPKTQGVVSKH